MTKKQIKMNLLSEDIFDKFKSNYPEYENEQETGRRELARFRLPYLLIIPDARKNVREIEGRQNFEKNGIQNSNSHK